MLRPWIAFALASVLPAASAAASVSVKLRGSTLVVAGDAGDDVVVIDGQESFSKLVVSVNGISFGNFVGVRNVRVNTKGGNDSVFVAAIEIGGNLSISTGTGDDTVEIDPFDLVTTEVFIGGDASLSLGGQAGDNVSIHEAFDQSVTIGGNLRIRNAANVRIDGFGTGSDSDALDIRIGGDLVIDTRVATGLGVGQFTVLLEEVDVGGRFRLRGANDPDKVGIANSHCAGAVSIALRGGDDVLGLGSSPSLVNEFNAKISLNGGPGADVLTVDPGNVFTSPPKIKSF